MAAMPMRSLRLWQDKIETEVAVFGDGPPLVFLHGSWGLRNDREAELRRATDDCVGIAADRLWRMRARQPARAVVEEPA